MTHLDAILGPLLLRNNCVIIPSLGGFVANNVSAKIDYEKGVISPPSKALSFNKNLNNNDGLIVHQLSREKNIPFDKAQEIVDLEVQQIKAELNQEKRVHFLNVGFLYINNAGKIAFEQDRFFNLLLSSYGLGDVHFLLEEEVTEQPVSIKEPIVSTPTPTIERTLPVHKTVAQPKVEEVETSEEVSEVPHPAVAETSSTRKTLAKIIRYAAVAAFVPVLFYGFWIPMKTDVLQSGVIYKEDFNPFRKNEAYLYSPDITPMSITKDEVESVDALTAIVKNLSSETPVFTYPLDKDLFIPVHRKQVKTVHSEHIEEIHATQEIVSNHFNYHAIAGCFSNPENAENLINELKAQGFNAYKVDVKGGLHRVSAGGATSNQEIISIQQNLSQAGVSAWVLKK